MKHTLAGITMTAALILALAPSAPATAQTADIAQVLQRFQSEPGVRDVQEATLRYALIDGDMMDNWTTRVRLANVLPGKIKLKYQKNETDDSVVQSREDLVREDEEDFTSPFAIAELTNTNRVDDDQRERIEVQADWDIHKIFFNNDELKVSGEITKKVKLREQLLNTVTKLYFERRRLQVEQVLKPTTDTSSAIRSQLRIDELTADIDALTGGWFSKQL